MGIRDFFKKQVKKEEEKIIRKRYTCNNEITKQELKDIRHKAAENVLKRNAKIVAGVTVSCAALGIAAFNLKDDNMKGDLKDKVITDGENIAVNSPDEKSELDLLLEDIDAIEDENATLEFLKEMYLKEYNKENNTNLTKEDIEFVRNSQNYVFDANGVYVTHGSLPDNTRNKLESDGIEYGVIDNIKVYSAQKVEDKEILESFALDGSNGVVNVVYGDEYVNGKTLECNSKNVLADMSGVMSNGIDLFVGFKHGENENSLALRKTRLGDAVDKYINRDMYKQIEADIEAGVR